MTDQTASNDDRRRRCVATEVMTMVSEMKKRAAWLAVAGCLALGGVFLVFATAGAGASAQESVNVSIGDDYYSPRNITINAGDSVVWVNNGEELHTITSDAQAFDSGLVRPGESWQFSFAGEGTFSYYCLVHGRDQSGTVVVQAAEPVAPPPAVEPPAAPPSVEAAPPAGGAAPPSSPEAPSAAAAPVSPGGGGPAGQALPPAAGFGPIGGNGPGTPLALALWIAGGAMLLVGTLALLRELRRMAWPSRA